VPAIEAPRENASGTTRIIATICDSMPSIIAANVLNQNPAYFGDETVDTTLALGIKLAPQPEQNFDSWLLLTPHCGQNIIFSF
jgi:hypothetical protein